jgi:3-oxoacyl-[acyl-carrier protein] reductase
MNELKGRTAVVTGASGAVGAAIAQRLAASGAYVFVGYHRGIERATDVARAICLAGGFGRPLSLDVTNPDSVRGAAETVLRERGQLDVLVNAAGVVRDAYFALADPDDFDLSLEVNLKGVHRTCSAFVRKMMAARRGAIINVGSVAGVRASPGQTAYSAAKGGLVALSRTLAVELAPHGIRVNVVLPGLLDVGMTQAVSGGALREKGARIPLGRFGTADEVAQVVSFLASDASSYLVGQTLVADGGLTL